MALALAALFLASCQTQVPARNSRMEQIRLASDGRGFVCAPSGRLFHPWGNNYGNQGRLIEDFWATNWATVSDDFHYMKAIGANVVRVHLQFGKFMLAPDQPNPESLARLRRLLLLAEDTGLYLDLTGLACYRRADVPPWFDKLTESERWRAQARFWGSIAGACAGSPAVYCYDLINEPVVATGANVQHDWYTGELGGLNFLQFINLEPRGRTMEEIALPWLGQMTNAIRQQDKVHLITAGLLPFNPGRNILDKFDFVSVHIYPEAGKVDQALATLRDFDIGKPVVIEETFPLSCSAAELKRFLLESRARACGWIGHYNGETINRLEDLQHTGKITAGQTLWLAWMELFRELGPAMLAANNSN